VPLRRERGAEPLHRQLEDALRGAIREGRLQPGAVLPSSRGLADQLDVSRGIVVGAYGQLVAEGYLVARPGGVTRVAVAAAEPPPTPGAGGPSPGTVETFDIEFRSGRPDLSLLPRAAWLRSVRRALMESPNDRFGYFGGRGMPELRDALAAYLNRVRGTATSADRIVIAGGTIQGIRLTADALIASGRRRFGLEDPGHAETRQTIEAAGAEVVPIPVDEGGICVRDVPAADVHVVVVTAAHQYPTGAVLPPDRRAELVAWANARDGVIVEDDYDAEFRYDREPIGAIQGLAPDRVIYAGSASKVFAPGMRLGWLAAPPALADAIAVQKHQADSGSPALDQLALADFIARGELDRHLRRMRPIYRRRRDALLTALRRHLPSLRPVGASAGLHVLAWLPPDMKEAAIVAAARAEGIAIEGLANRLIRRSGPEGLVLGYGSIAETDMDRAVRRLAGAVERSRSRPSAST
jgi:GntR family transcriptional regulator/MocR family aminotransferase